jgi:sugar phosphate isomerase/epimerase
MQHALSTFLFANHRLTTATLDRLGDAGLERIEIFCARQHIDWTNRAQVVELGHWFRDSKMKLLALHAPVFSDDVWGRTGPNALLNIAEPVRARRIAVVDEIKRAIEIAETVPCQYVVQHLGIPGDSYDERKLDAAFSSLDELSLFARQRGAEVLLENLPGGLANSERLVLFLAMTHLRLGFCFDTGHAHLEEGVAAALDRMRERVRCVHLSDNDGRSDLHLPPGKGTVDWAALRAPLARLGCPVVLTLRDSGTEPPADQARRSLEQLHQVFDKT